MPTAGSNARSCSNQLLTRPQGTAAHRFGCMGGAIGVLLPTLDPARQLHHRALAQRAMGTAGVQPGLHGGGNGGMRGRHGKRRPLPRAFPGFPRLRRLIELSYGVGTQHHSRCGDGQRSERGGCKPLGRGAQPLSDDPIDGAGAAD